MVELVPVPLFNAPTRFKICPLGATKFMCKSPTQVCVMLNFTFTLVTTEPAGIPETTIAGETTPASSPSVITVFTVPDATVAVTKFELVRFVICNDCELPLQIVEEVGVTDATKGLTVKVTMFVKSVAEQAPMKTARYW